MPMRKLLLLLIVYASCYFNTKGQDIDSTNIFQTVYQRVTFITPDSTYYFTKFIEPTGKFYFKNGYYDVTLEKDSSILLQVKKRKVQGQYLLTYQFRSDIDSVNCILSDERIEHTKPELKQITDKLNVSYVLKQLGEINKIRKNEIRLLYPCEELNNSTHYELVKIKILNDSAKITLITGVSDGYNGIHPIRTYTSFMRKRDFIRLKKQLDKLKEIQNRQCREPGNPWLLELYNGDEYKSFFISKYCTRGRKEIKPITAVFYSILVICKNYFNIDCAVD